MRTTIELPDAQRARLLALAARRGEKGFSRIVQEALSQYLDRETTRADARALALALGGTLPVAEADSLEAATREAREGWR